MSVWEKERTDIQDLADGLAREREGTKATEWRQKILSAIWLDQLPMVHCYNGDRDQLFTPFGREELRQAVAAFGELNVGRIFMGVPVRATSKILPTALPFETLAKLAWEAYSDFFIDVYLDRVLIKPAAVQVWLAAAKSAPKQDGAKRDPGRPAKEGPIARAAILALYPDGPPLALKNAALCAEVREYLSKNGNSPLPSAKTICNERSRLSIGKNSAA